MNLGRGGGGDAGHRELVERRRRSLNVTPAEPSRDQDHAALTTVTSGLLATCDLMAASRCCPLPRPACAGGVMALRRTVTPRPGPRAGRDADLRSRPAVAKRGLRWRPRGAHAFLKDWDRSSSRRRGPCSAAHRQDHVPAIADRGRASLQSNWTLQLTAALPRCARPRRPQLERRYVRQKKLERERPASWVRHRGFPPELREAARLHSSMPRRAQWRLA